MVVAEVGLKYRKPACCRMPKIDTATVAAEVLFDNWDADLFSELARLLRNVTDDEDAMDKIELWNDSYGLYLDYDGLNTYIEDIIEWAQEEYTPITK